MAKWELMGEGACGDANLIGQLVNIVHTFLNLRRTQSQTVGHAHLAKIAREIGGMGKELADQHPNGEQSIATRKSEKG